MVEVSGRQHCIFTMNSVVVLKQGLDSDKINIIIVTEFDFEIMLDNEPILSGAAHRSVKNANCCIWLLQDEPS